MSVGSLSAFGMTYAHMSRGLCIALAGLSIAGEYKLLSLFRSTHGWIAALVIFSIVGIFCMLAIRSGRTFQNLIRRPAPAQYVKTRSLPRWTWFAKKFWRYTPLRRSFLVTILLGAGLAAIVVKYGALSSSFIALPAQLLAAALTSDIRALARPRLPPEIGALKGTLYFVRQSITIGVVVAIIALLPIEIAAIIFDLSITALLAGIISGVAFGLFVGAWLIPCPSDISTQLTANLACLCIAVGTSQINNFSQRYLYILQCSLALLAIGLTFHFEYKRNALTWRKHDI
jgi:hypothetical protein